MSHIRYNSIKYWTNSIHSVNDHKHIMLNTSMKSSRAPNQIPLTGWIGRDDLWEMKSFFLQASVRKMDRYETTIPTIPC